MGGMDPAHRDQEGEVSCLLILSGQLAECLCSIRVTLGTIVGGDISRGSSTSSSSTVSTSRPGCGSREAPAADLPARGHHRRRPPGGMSWSGHIVIINHSLILLHRRRTALSFPLARSPALFGIPGLGDRVTDFVDHGLVQAQVILGLYRLGDSRFRYRSRDRR